MLDGLWNQAPLDRQGVEQEDLYSPLCPQAMLGLWAPALLTLHSHRQRSSEDRAWTGNPWGCHSPQGVSEPNSHSSHEFSPFFCPGRPWRKTPRRSKPNFPWSHPSASSCSEFKTPLFLSQNLLSCFCPVPGSGTAWLHPRDLLGQGTNTTRAPGKRTVPNFWFFIRPEASQTNSHT